MTLDVEQIKQDMEAGTPGPWGANTEDQGMHGNTPYVCVFEKYEGGYLGQHVCDVPCSSGWPRHKQYPYEANARRIARVPDLESAFLAQAAEIAALKERLAKADKVIAALGACVAEGEE